MTCVCKNKKKVIFIGANFWPIVVDVQKTVKHVFQHFKKQKAFSGVSIGSKYIWSKFGAS